MYSVTILMVQSYGGFLQRSYFFFCLGIYDLTGSNRQDKAIHHAGLMRESKFNLVSMIYINIGLFGDTQRCLLEANPGYILGPTKFLRSGGLGGSCPLGDRDQ